MEWVSVEERLPEQCGFSVLLYGVNTFSQGCVFQGFTDYCKTGKLLFCSDAKDINIDAWSVTHWMPLPPPPKED